MEANCTLELSGIERISCGTRGVDKPKHLNQGETYWIHKLKTLTYEDSDFLPLL